MILAFHIGPIEFDQPQWLLLLGALVPLTVWIGRQSLSGMGTASRRVALGVRLVVIFLLVGAVAKPYWRKESRTVNVVVIRDTSDSVRRPTTVNGATTDLTQQAKKFVQEAARFAKPDDLISIVTAAKKSYVQALPVPARDEPESEVTGETDATNLAEAVTLAMAIMPGSSANRLLLISDFNQTAGDLAQVANAAKAAGVPIDVLPLKYRYDKEVLVERIVAPATARMGQNINLKVLISALKAGTGSLNLTINGEPVDLDATGESMAMKVRLEKGMNAVSIPIALPRPGPLAFRAYYQPDDPSDDAIQQNNQSMAVTFVQSEGRVLLLAPSEDEVSALKQTLEQAKIAVEVREASNAPTTKEEWAGYDAVVMANTPAYAFTQRQQEDLRAYVHDLGGGLVMIGGPDAFGAGGWIGSPLADALPIKLEPPQKRQMPRGALVLVMHSCEMPQGNYWGKQVALSAVNALSRLDLAGVLEFSFGRGDWWVHPLSEVGNKAAISRAINSLTYGDMPSFDNLLNMAIKDLRKAAAGMKHIVIISDGDPQLLDNTILATCRMNKISISCVLVYPHQRGYSTPDWQKMQHIAKSTGGNFYPIIEQGEFAKLPEIFIKEAQVVKRSLIWEGPAFQPRVIASGSEPMRGLGTAMYPISGYIVGADREGLSVVTLRGQENDPVLAHWQYGLGKAVAFTSDVGSRWARSWVGSPKFRPFWEQHVRWAMRPGGSADVRVLTEDLGERTRIIVEALDSKGERLNFMRFDGRVLGPNNSTQSVELRQEGPGRYVGEIDSAAAGAYVANFRYWTPASEGSPAREGNLQAAVTRPFADEYRTLQDNAALGKLIAEKTGGRVIDVDPTKAELWSRAGLRMPVATRSIWLTVSLIAIGLFLTDVAVRRVRFDPRAMAAAVRRGLGQGRREAGAQMASLREARERAKAGIGASATEQAAAKAAAAKAKKDQATSRAKFEATIDELVKGRSNEALPTLIDKTIKTRPRTEGEKKEEEGGMSRLKKARDRAKEEFGE
ncbi:MAG: hypothetical protein IT438_04080 [Phycisphaerales bacterium]|nr:hypothetical protein [Phycisphaerales bacterium]